MYRRHELFDREQGRRFGEEEQSFCAVARPTRTLRSLSQIDILDFRVLGFVGLIMVLVCRKHFTIANEFARAATALFGLRRRSLPNQALLTTPKLQPFLFFSTRQYGVSDL